MNLKLSSASILGLLVTICCTNLAAAGMSDKVEELFEQFRVRMCHPFPKWNLPALDPYEVEHEEVFMDDNILKNFSASVTNLKMTGLSDFVINEIKITTISQKFKLNITFPLEELQSQYTAQGSLGHVVNLVGDDKITSHLKDVQIVISGGIKLGLKFAIKNLKITFGIGEFYVEMGQIMEFDRLNNFVHNLINDLSVELFGDLWEDYGEQLTSKLQDSINKKMSKFSLKDVIGMITGSGEPIFGDDPPGDCKSESKVKSELS